MRAAFAMAQANWYRIVKADSEQQRNSDESDDTRRAMDAGICKLRALVEPENLALRARAIGATRSPLNLQLRRARAIVNGFQDLRDFCASMPPAANAGRSSAEEVVLIEDESEEEDAARTRRLVTKRRLAVQREDGTTQGKGNKRAKHTHSLASIGDATERRGKHNDKSARMAEEDTEQARGMRFVSVESHGLEQREDCESLTLMGWAEEVGIPAESLVAVRAMLTASRMEGVRGVTLGMFLGELLGTFGVDIDVSTIPIPPADTLVPFLSPPNKPWTQKFLSSWRGTTTYFANLWVRGACDSGRIDFRVSSGIISGECNLKSGEFTSLDLAHVVDRVPKESIAHFAVVKKISEDIRIPTNGQTQSSTAVYRISRGSDTQLISKTDTPSKLLLLIEH